MIIRKFSERLWRLHNPEADTIKDVYIKQGLLLPPMGRMNVLTDEETAFIENEIERIKK